jgi:hypothetical protein
MSGAKQIRAPCPHVADRPSELTFHSVVTPNNTSFWERENRLPDDVDESDLEAVLEYAGDDVTVAVCNSCRRIVVDPGPKSEVVHSGDPYADDRVGEWLVDVHADDEAVAAFGGNR